VGCFKAEAFAGAVIESMYGESDLLGVMELNHIFFGKNRRIRSFMLSLAPRSQEAKGWAKKGSASIFTNEQR